MKQKYNSYEGLEEKVIDMYLNEKKSAIKIDNELCIGWHSVYKILEDRGIKRRTNKENYKMIFDDTYFEKIDTEHKAYHLGFLMADGTILNSRHCSKQVKLDLAVEDREEVEKFCDDLVIDKKRIKVYPHYNTVGQDVCRIIVNSDKLCEDLYRFGVTPRKSLTLKFPVGLLPENTPVHFIRGYFDGDGSISGKFGCPQFKMGGTSEFLEETQKIFMNDLGLRKTKFDQRWPERKNNNYSLGYGGRRQIVRIREWLYKDATIYLSRKYNKFQTYGGITYGDKK